MSESEHIEIRNQVRVQGVEQTVEKICGTLYGNGKEGITTSVHTMKKTIDNIERLSWFVGLAVSSLVIETVWSVITK